MSMSVGNLLIKKKGMKWMHVNCPLIMNPYSLSSMGSRHVLRRGAPALGLKREEDYRGWRSRGRGSFLGRQWQWCNGGVG